MPLWRCATLLILREFTMQAMHQRNRAITGTIDTLGNPTDSSHRHAAARAES
jgi:hypothetical protein